MQVEGMFCQENGVTDKTAVVFSKRHAVFAKTAAVFPETAAVLSVFMQYWRIVRNSEFRSHSELSSFHSGVTSGATSGATNTEKMHVDNQ